jgi:hypothetical protein
MDTLENAMKTTLADKLAIASVLVTALITAAGWAFAAAAEHRAQLILHTSYAQPTPEYEAAFAASEAAEAGDHALVQGR